MTKVRTQGFLGHSNARRPKLCSPGSIKRTPVIPKLRTALVSPPIYH